MSKARTRTAAAATALTLGAAAGTVYQIPATALAVSGLVVPGPYFASVQAMPTVDGEISLSAPAGELICSTSAAGALVTIDWFSLTTGRAGSTTVKPCPNYIDPTPTDVVIAPGSGQVVMTVRVHGSPLSPNAGQPSLPGVGTFAVP